MHAYHRLLVTAGAMLLLAAPAASAAPKSDLWERWTAHDPASTAVVDHEDWSRLLRTYLVSEPDGINRFAYARVRAADRDALEGYVARLVAVPISGYNRGEQRAFWINLYNVLTVKLIVDHYPVASILDISISPGLFSFGPWDKKLIEVEGEALSLNDIEHRILRPIWRDPRLHYAVNCASLGCPNLREVAFTAENAERLLEQGAREYVNHARGAEFIDGQLIVSSIYHWFKEDFGDSDRGVIEHLGVFADPELAERLAKTRRLSGHDYDWDLNGVSAQGG